MNKSVIMLSVFFCATLSLIAQKDEKKDGSKEKHEKQVQANEKKLELFYEKGMVDSIAGMYSTNCYFAHEFMIRLESQDEVKKKLKADFKAGFKVIDLAFSTDDLKTYSDIILETGILTIKYVAPVTKATLTKKYNYNMVWKESSDKKYRIRSEIWTPVENPCK